MGQKVQDIHNAVNNALFRTGDCFEITHSSPSDSISAFARAPLALSFHLLGAWQSDRAVIINEYPLPQVARTCL